MSAGTVDWGGGRYERTATELEPVARAVVARAAIQPGDRVIDLACGTGNAAVLAGALGAPVTGIDAAPRLLDVARERARSHRVQGDFLEGDLLDLPVDAGTADVVISVFGLVFASVPSQAVRSAAMVRRNDMPASSASAATASGSNHGKRLGGDESVTRSRTRPIAPSIASIGPAGTQALILREANEDPDRFLVHSPYVVHELRGG